LQQRRFDGERDRRPFAASARRRGSVRGRMGVGPNAEMGGDGKGESDRGIRFFYDWSRRNLGRWEYPAHVR
jgi:hypothetical protein